MDETKAKSKNVRLYDDACRHLHMGAAHFGCSMSTLLSMLLAAVRIAEMPESDNPKTLMAIERFEKHLSNIDLTTHTYLFKE